ncbi:MAG TPA: YdcF family protein [Burkholderiaceae bacterium]|nr:YdcF family protein [Burkholderiaceae bacterium]
MTLSSQLARLVIPGNLCLVLVSVGVVFLLVRRRKTGWTFVATGLGWLLLWSIPATSLWLGGRLEFQHPHVAARQLPQAQAIVVLGGHTANNRQNWFQTYNPVTAASRVDRAAELYREQRAPTLVLSGAALDGTLSEAQMMARLLGQQHIPEHALLLETQSLTTHENGVYTARLLKQEGLTKVLLVTSALHMPRAMAVFRHEGLEAVPAGVTPQILPPDEAGFFFAWLPNGRALEASRSIIKEYAAFFIYRLRGWL